MRAITGFLFLLVVPAVHADTDSLERRRAIEQSLQEVYGDSAPSEDILTERETLAKHLVKGAETCLFESAPAVEAETEGLSKFEQQFTCDGLILLAREADFSRNQTLALFRDNSDGRFSLTKGEDDATAEDNLLLNTVLDSVYGVPEAHEVRGMELLVKQLKTCEYGNVAWTFAKSIVMDVFGCSSLIKTAKNDGGFSYFEVEEALNSAHPAPEKEKTAVAEEEPDSGVVATAGNTDTGTGKKRTTSKP